MEKDFNQIMGIDKPKGLTSHDVVAIIRGILKVKKVGHAGTLDPQATGVLVVLTGEKTKEQNKLMDLEKEYLADIVLGRETDTYDTEGYILSENIKKAHLVTLNEIKKGLKKFQGEIYQTVPPFSAVKVKGERLYRLARKKKNAKISLPTKKVNIYNIDLVRFQKGTRYFLPLLTIKVVCSKGTYIRSIAYDLGKTLGCGAYLQNLIRLSVGSYTLEKAYKIRKEKGLWNLISPN